MTRGSSLVELTVGLSIFGALLALGMPGWRRYGEEGRAAQCATNRHALEVAERACAVNRDGKACLSMKTLTESGYLSATPTCASDGTYVWIADAAQPGYPKMGCSKHFFPPGSEERR
jgi:type II secretory pathway pseudopilin PulG